MKFFMSLLATVAPFTFLPGQWPALMIVPMVLVTLYLGWVTKGKKRVFDRALAAVRPLPYPDGWLLFRRAYSIDQAYADRFWWNESRYNGVKDWGAYKELTGLDKGET